MTDIEAAYSPPEEILASLQEQTRMLAQLGLLRNHTDGMDVVGICALFIQGVWSRRRRRRS